MKKVFYFLVLSIGILFMGCSDTEQRTGKPKILVFSKTMGFKHSSIPAGMAAIQKLGDAHGFEVDTTKAAETFNDESLQPYSAVVFLSTTGNVLDHVQEAAFERYIQAGGGYVGIHAAADTEYDWGWYSKLAGAQFLSHPAGTPEADFHIVDTKFEATAHFTDSIWRRKDEIYNYKKINPEVNVVMTVDESTYEGGKNGEDHPFAWYHEYDGGRAFYTGAGHTDETYSEELFLKHLLGGIQYAIGGNKVLDYAKATTQIPPDIDRFSKVELLSGGLYEPTEMTVVTANDILIAQRRGEILRFDESKKELKQVAFLEVYHKTLETPDANAEEGLMGIQKDPDYDTNHWVYVYYAPAGDTWVNRLSRFQYKDAVFDMDSEQIVLEVDTQREICCHTGGSIAFGPDKLLYLSTGDNSTPFNEKDVPYTNNGFAPLNDLPGKEQYDARRSSANTNDLRGKILRIKVKEDGSYAIPKGNLFPEGTEKTRPEIYTMGHRNPYRISVDPKKGYVYWGDIGPDSRADSLTTRGPMGYDEMNQARSAGNFGWPLFIGDNKPYMEYDYATGETGTAFDPLLPVNNSRNNTGLKELPPAQPAFMFYPYTDSPDYPQAGSGGRNAMAGPTYYSDLFPDGGGLPSYYDGKVIVYDWMRGWMMAVSLFEDGTFNKMEPFASDIEVNNLIDMELGPDGRMYLLEYGSGWFTKNDDSGLGYVSFNGGNRAPLIDNMIVDKTSGKLPLSIKATVTARDREKDVVSYEWDLGNGETRETTEPEIEHTYKDAGDYRVSVTVKDDKGAAASAKPVLVTAGNSRPEISIDLSGGNASFFIAGTPVNYKVTVNDPDGEDTIDLNNVFVSVDYMEGMDEVNKSLGHHQVSAAVTGKALTQSMDCKTCHKEAEASIGPTYLAVAEKYQGDANALSYLQKKIIAGGAGVWGEVMMPAHPNVTSSESEQIARYIQSLVATGNEEKSLPLAGSIVPKPSPADNVMVLTASYTDKGGAVAGPLTGVNSVTLRGSTVPFTGKDKISGFAPIEFSGMKLLIVPAEEGWFALEEIDLTGVTSVGITAGWQEAPKAGMQIEMRLNAPDGPLLGTGSMPVPVAGQPGGMVVIPLAKSINEKAKEVYFVYKPKAGAVLGQVALMNVRFNG